MHYRETKVLLKYQKLLHVPVLWEFDANEERITIIDEKEAASLATSFVIMNNIERRNYFSLPLSLRYSSRRSLLGITQINPRGSSPVLMTP
jgi:pyoverdine/dityrosine biosynthesis protein Dit1